jgi:hypothetical protein
MTEEKRDGRGRPRNDNTVLPLPIMENYRWVWTRPAAEAFKRAMAGEPPGPVEETSATADGQVERVSISQVAAELGVHRRTVTRRVDAAVAAKEKATAKASPSRRRGGAGR